MKESIEKFKSDFGGLRVRAKASIIGGALIMTSIGFVNLSFRFHI